MKGRASPLLLFAGTLLASAADSSAPASNSTRPRPTSPQTAARLSAELPRYSPVPVEPTLPAPLASPTSIASPKSGDDEPLDGIVRLPRYEVRERPLPPLRERDLLTPAGRLALVQKRHPGLKLGPFSRLNFRRGLEMLAEEQQVERSREMFDLVAFQRFAAASRKTSASAPRVAAE
jgi:hypothetical protein